MKYLIILLTSILSTAPINLKSQTGGEKSFSHSMISEPEKNDSTLWNSTFLKNDIFQYKENNLNPSSITGYPIETLAFPVVDYGAGAAGVLEYTVASPYMWSGVGLFVGKHTYNPDEFRGQDNHIAFFNLMVFTDTLDIEGYTLADHSITSRNHPDYLGQGRILTKQHQIDYVAFHRADNAALAVIGGRLFDLGIGQTIIVVPQQNGSVRMHQINTPYLPMQEAASYIQRLVQSDLVQEMMDMGKPISETIKMPLPARSHHLSQNQLIYLTVESENGTEGMFNLEITTSDSLGQPLSPTTYMDQSTPFSLELPVGIHSLTITNHDTEQRLLKKVQCDPNDSRKGMAGTFEPIGRIEVGPGCSFRVL